MITQPYFYPEEYIIEEDKLEKGETFAHRRLVNYIADIFKQMFKAQGWAITVNLDITHPAIRNSQHYIVPDIALIKVRLSEEEDIGLEKWDALAQPVALVIEASSEIFWENDITEKDFGKPCIYGRMGVKEYFAYDPDHIRNWENSDSLRLRGWKYVDQQPVEMTPDEQGRLWSEELESYLVPDDMKIYLTDHEGKKRLTRSEIWKEIKRIREEAESKIAELLKQVS